MDGACRKPVAPAGETDGGSNAGSAGGAGGDGGRTRRATEGNEGTFAGRRGEVMAGLSECKGWSMRGDGGKLERAKVSRSDVHKFVEWMFCKGVSAIS